MPPLIQSISSGDFSSSQNVELLEQRYYVTYNLCMAEITFLNSDPFLSIQSFGIFCSPLVTYQSIASRKIDKFYLRGRSRLFPRARQSHFSLKERATQSQKSCKSKMVRHGRPSSMPNGSSRTLGSLPTMMWLSFQPLLSTPTSLSIEAM